MEVKISALVPVYNVEKTLARCVESILAQTFKDYEIVLVDDGSTDGSGKICDEYAEKYDFISVIHKQNEGLGPTRNAGIRQAKGKYIYHCDSDDWIDENLFADAYALMENSNADLLVFGYKIFTEKDGNIVPYDTITTPSVTLKGENEARKFFCEQYYNAFVVQSACNRFYSRSFITENEIYFPDLRRCQDMAYSLLLFDKTKTLVATEKAYYNYIIEPGVFKGRSYKEMIDTYVTVFEKTRDMFMKWGLYDEEQKKKLSNRMLEHIANYSGYALQKKYKAEKKENMRLLFDNPVVSELADSYVNDKNSRYMKMFCSAVKAKSAILLNAATSLQQTIASRKN